MSESNQSEAKSPASSWRWALALTLLSLVLQIVAALALHVLFQGQEIASDVAEYRLYVENPLVLLDPPPTIDMNGGWVAAPLMPLLLAPVYHPLKWLGCNDFFAYRGTMICWLTLGFGFTIFELFRRWGSPLTKREVLIALALTVSPLAWMPSAIVAQDEAVAGMWCGLCFFCWSRWGVWGCWWAAAVGMFAAKPFFLIYFAALWMAYPTQRKALVIASIAAFAMLLGFMYWRDGEIRYLYHVVQSNMSGSLYSLSWLVDNVVTEDASRAHRHWAKAISTWPIIITMTAFALSAWRIRFTLPSAVVGLYYVMFTLVVGMMPEYELWFWSWSMLLIWVAGRRGEWLLASLLYVHSVLGYTYKILYSCDSKNFNVTGFKQTAIWYDQHIGLDLWWVMVLLSVALALNTLCLAILLWRKYPRLIDAPSPAIA